MANYIQGQCLILAEQNNAVFCEILGYRGSGEYYVSLTRSPLLDRTSNRFTPTSILNESIINELAVDFQQLGLT